MSLKNPLSKKLYLESPLEWVQDTIARGRELKRRLSGVAASISSHPFLHLTTISIYNTY